MTNLIISEIWNEAIEEYEKDPTSPFLTPVHYLTLMYHQAGYLDELITALNRITYDIPKHEMRELKKTHPKYELTQKIVRGLVDISERIREISQYSGILERMTYTLPDFFRSHLDTHLTLDRIITASFSDVAVPVIRDELKKALSGWIPAEKMSLVQWASKYLVPVAEQR